MKNEIHCADASCLSKRVMIVSETKVDQNMLAFYPEGNPSLTVWLKKDDVATLVAKLNAWVKERGGKPYDLPRVSGSL